MSFQASNYTPDNLAALLSEAQDNQLMRSMGQTSYDKAGLSYDEMLNYAPAALTQPRPLNGLGDAQSMNPLFYVLAAAALGYIFFVKKERYGY